MNTNATEIERIIVNKLSNSDTQDAFYLVDLEKVHRQFLKWQELLPMVQPFYAIKCNPNPAIMHTLVKLGTGFDCASRDEIDRCLDMGVPPEKLIFANPCKLESHIAHAKLRNVKRMTFDNEDELIKTVKIFPDAELVIRIITDDSSSLCKFSSKFGTPLSSVKQIFKTAKSIGAHLVGVSFHVGSGCADPAAFAKAVADSRTVFGWAEEFGYHMTLLDLGGGWQGVDDMEPTLSDVAKHVIPELNKFSADTVFIAEPGRYFAAKSHTLVTRIHSRRVIRNESGSPINVLYYVNDGVYQSFNCILFDHQNPAPIIVPYEVHNTNNELIPSTVFGPTCDSLDCICKNYPMPLLEVGNWMYFENMGAYTTAAATKFNGFAGAVIFHYMWGSEIVENFSDIVEGKLPGITSDVKESTVTSVEGIKAQ